MDIKDSKVETFLKKERKEATTLVLAKHCPTINNVILV